MSSSASVRLLFSIVAVLCLYVAPTVALSSSAAGGTKVAVFGGTGFVGSAVCERLAKKGYDVVAVSRRGVNPKPGDKYLDQVTWVKGDATDKATVKKIVQDVDAVVHSIGLLFDVESGLGNLNTIVSGSGSLPGDESTYDNITRKTMFNVIEAMEAKQNFFSKNKQPALCFVSCAESGWPDVAMGSQVENNLAPDWLKKYLIAKRAVEARMNESKAIRPVIYRPSLIWNWKKLDVLPVIPVFNLASAIGVPFVDKTVRVETLADAIVAGVEDSEVSGVQRFFKMEQLAKQV